MAREIKRARQARAVQEANRRAAREAAARDMERSTAQLRRNYRTLPPEIQFMICQEFCHDYKSVPLSRQHIRAIREFMSANPGYANEIRLAVSAKLFDFRRALDEYDLLNYRLYALTYAWQRPVRPFIAGTLQAPEIAQENLQTTLPEFQISWAKARAGFDEFYALLVQRGYLEMPTRRRFSLATPDARQWDPDAWTAEQSILAALEGLQGLGDVNLEVLARAHVRMDAWWKAKWAARERADRVVAMANCHLMGDLIG